MGVEDRLIYLYRRVKEKVISKSRAGLDSAQ